MFDIVALASYHRYFLDSLLIDIKKHFARIEEPNSAFTIKPFGFRCASVCYRLAKELITYPSFERVFPTSELKEGETRILGLYDGVTYFQSNTEASVQFYSGNYGCEGSRVK